MDVLGIVGIPVITILCYVVGMALKAWDLFDDRKIPVMMIVAGVILGAVAYLWVPALSIADNVITALAVGAVSGMGATCVNQIYKQAKKEE